MVYDKPIAGKIGVYSTVSKSFVFGICCDYAREAKKELVKRIGYWDAQKWRWQCRNWTKKDIGE